MPFLDDIWNKAKKLEKRIVLPETEDPRTLKAADIILKSKLARLILIGNKDNITSLAKENGAEISRAEIIDPKKDPKIDRYCELHINKLREHKHELSYNDAKALLETDYPYFGAMMMANDDADGMVSGACHSTAHTIKATLYSVGMKDNIKTLSSFFVMITQNRQLGLGGILFFADCAVIPCPSENQLCDIAVSTAQSFSRFMGREPRVAMLSFSTKGSGKSPASEKVAAATKLVQDKVPDMLVDGEMQLDAAIVPAIGKMKAPQSKVAGRANVLIFPDLNAGNIGYKLVERIGGAMALGPIFQGCAKPINDLSRGCSIEDIVNITAITAIQA